MDTNQPTPQSQSQPVRQPGSSNPGLFGTKVPSAVAFATGVLLFFLPFVDIKCNNMSLQQVSGFQLATGFQMKDNKDQFSLDNTRTDNDKETTKATAKTEKKDPNLYAMVALGLGLIGLILSFTNMKAAAGGAMVTGILSAGALIGLMLDIKKKIKLDMPKTSSGSEMDGAFNRLGENVRITADFTPWFYVAVIAFLVAAFFSYRRMQSIR